MDSVEQKIDKILGVVVGLKTDMTEVKSDLSHVKTVGDQHTTALDGISKQLLDLTTDKAAML